MGDAEKISSEIAKVYGNPHIFNIIFSVMLVLIIPFLCFILFYLEAEISGNIHYTMALEELIVFGIIPAVMLLLNHKGRILCMVELFSIEVIYIVFRVLSRNLYSVLLFAAYTIFTGKQEVLSVIYNQNTELNNFPFLLVSIAFAFIIEFLQIILIITSKGFKKKTDIKIKKIALNSLRIIIAFCFCISIAIPFLCTYQSKYFNVNFVFLDKKTEPDKISWFEDFPIVPYPMSIVGTTENKTNYTIKEETRITVKTSIRGLTYTAKVFDIEYKSDYKYLAVLPEHIAFGSGILFDGQVTERNYAETQYYELSDNETIYGEIGESTPEFRFIVHKAEN
ncbi:MAG: hypothetical protein MJ168_01655 [Clostridia bacterium]|nr:hypothetical protein [Clostridia bacterium]